MPNFDYSLKTPQGQVQASGPRDQGTNIRSQANINLAQGVQQIAGGIEQMARDDVREEAESDMSAFQADRIEREQIFREKAATITNDAEYEKAVDKYVTDLNKHADGKRQDGTKVFRNGMGKSAYKDFSTNYNARFKAAGKEHVFGLKRKKTKLNYRRAINSGIKNNNPDAISESYNKLEDRGFLSHEERLIEEERDTKAMTVNYFQQTKASLMTGTEELLNQVNQEKVVFDGTGVKPRTDSLAEASKVINDSFENYKAEVYTNDNLEETEKLALVNGMKASLQALNHKVQMQNKAAKVQIENNYTQAQIEVQSALYNNPGADPEEILLEAQSKFSTVLKPEDNLKILKELNTHQDKRLKAETSRKEAVELATNDIAAEEEAYSYSSKGDPKGTRFRDIMRRVDKMESGATKTNSIKQLNDKSPFNKKGSSEISDFTSRSMNHMKAELGLNLTEAEFKKLDSERTMKPLANGWFSWDRGFTPEQEAQFKDSSEKFYDFTPESMRQSYLNRVMRNAQKMFQDGKPEEAEAHIKQELNILKKEQNDLKHIESYLKDATPRNTNPYSFLK